MNKREQFREALQNNMTMLLATAAQDSVTMRMVSPLSYQGAVLIFTDRESTKYRQLQANPHCSFAVGPFFAEATVEFRGETMLPENQALRDAYSVKFPGAFDEGMEFGGRKAEFLLLHPTRLSGWAFPDGVEPENGIPSIPFAIDL